jgi:predicted AlkP superfamily pyrophosphatase or phosphodiesterase
MSSITSVLGVDNPYRPLQSDTLSDLSDYDNLVLLVVDGLGYNYLSERGSGTLLKQSTKEPLTSVFPPSTGSAITTFFTGLAPQQHAVTGYYVHLHEFGIMSKILPFTSAFDWKVLDVDISKVIDVENQFQRINREYHAILGNQIVDSIFTRYMTGNANRIGYHDLHSFFQSIEEIIKSSTKLKYVYAYWPELDDINHGYGSDSEKSQKHLHEFDQSLKEFIDKIQGTNTKLIITSDHGFNNVELDKLIYMHDHPRLMDYLTVPVCGDSRTNYYYVRPSKTNKFERYVAENLGHACDLFVSNDLVVDNWFGLFEPNPKLDSRIGDYTLIFKDGFSILNSFPGFTPPKFIGHHGGTTEDEVMVPLITFDC